ncbi:histidine kinase [Hamadaea sp. NPDC050747]|uniref:sensor histidine kinase n=1 Tax=Hamadaea sp. NPDC050747 TaxID=3155789 RepID=UPI0033CC787B
MSFRRLLDPLRTVGRRGVYLLLGSVIATPYAVLAWALAEVWQTNGGAVAVPLIGIGAAIGLTPALLPATRGLQIAAARTLLDVDVPDPLPGTPLDAQTRLRAALWYFLHVGGGAVVAAVLSVLLPVGPVLAVSYHLVAGVALTAGELIVAAYAVAGLAALARLMAPVLLGPSTVERIRALEERQELLLEHNRLARELHDSVGHALTVAVVQAGAARELLRSDPAFAERALIAIEERSREAAADLDHVLGLLRRDLRKDRDESPTGSILDLAPHAKITGDLGRLPGVVRREAYRIVQEGLTNAARHADDAYPQVTVAVGERTVTVEITNGPVGSPTPRTGGGRGLAGLRERVALLGGRFEAGPDEGAGWRVTAWLPFA